MVNLIITPQSASPEMTFSEYEPHFNYIVRNTRTPTYIATKYPELFYHKDKTLVLDSLKITRRALSALLDVAIKDINVITFPKALISPEMKVFIKIFDIIKTELLHIPDNSVLLNYLDKLKIASKIITYQEIFTCFAMAYEIPCLTFAADGNVNNYKNSPGIKIVHGETRNKNKLIEEFLS